MNVRGIVYAYGDPVSSDLLSLSELKKLLFGRGLSFCCVTQHADTLTSGSASAFVAECHRLSDQAFVFIPGFEVSYDNTSLQLVGTNVFLANKTDESVLRRWREVTPLIFLARNTATHELPNTTLLSLIDGVEVWDQDLDGSVPNIKTLKMFRQSRKLKPELRAFAGTHRYGLSSRFLPELILTIDIPDTYEIMRQLSLGFYTIQHGTVVLDAEGNFISGSGFALPLRILWSKLHVLSRAVLGLVTIRT